MTVPFPISSSAFLSALRRCAGPDALVVGGAVRDRLLGRPTEDLDIVIAGVDAVKPSEKLAAAVGGRAFSLHADLGISRVVWARGHVDIALRQGATALDDLARRDFTINAMAVPVSAWGSRNWKRAIIDPHRGLADLRRGAIVPVSNRAFRDDPLRLLRAFRIAAELDFSIPAATMSAIRRHRGLARRPAAERVREELLKTFSSPRAHPALVGMDRTGVLDVIFPVAPALRRTAPRYYGTGGVLKHTLDSVMLFEDIERKLAIWFPRHHRKVRAYLAEPVAGYSRSAHCKWGLLLHDIGKPKTARVREGRLRFFEHEHVGADMVESLASRYRWSSDEQARYARLVRHHMRPGNLAVHPEAGDKAFHRFFRDLGDDAVAMLLVSLADHLTYLTAAQRRRRSSAHEKTTIRMMARFYGQKARVLPERLLTGHDVMKAFDLPPSPLIGALLNEAMEAQVDGKARTREQAIEFLRGRLPVLQAAARKGA